MYDDLKASDQVELKSGGPTMTIRSINHSFTAICDWFNTLDGQRYEGHFHVVQLKRVPEREA